MAAQLAGRKVALFTLIAVTITVAICLLLVEAGLRIAGRRPAYLDPDLYTALPDARTYGLRPGYRGLYSGGKVSVGPLGLRRGRRAGEAPGALLVLGDSVTFGQGLDDEQTLPAQLEALLGAPVENGGVPGYNTQIQLAQLRLLLPLLRPSRVVLIYLLDNDTDLRPGVWVGPDGSLDFHLRKGLLGKMSHAAIRHCVLYGKLRGLFKVRQQVLPPDSAAPFSKGDLGWRRSQEALLSMRDLLRAQGVPFLVAGVGLTQNLSAMPTLAAFCAEHGLPFSALWRTTDLAEYARRYTISPTDSHPNAAATAQMAAALQGLLTGRSSAGILPR